MCSVAEAAEILDLVRDRSCKSDDYWRGPFDQMGAAGIDVGKRKNGSKRSRVLALANPEIAAKRMGALCRFKRLQEECNGNTR